MGFCHHIYNMILITYLILHNIIYNVNSIKLNPKIQGSIVGITIGVILSLFLAIVAIYAELYQLLLPCFAFLVFIAIYPIYLKKTEYIIEDDKIIKNRDIFGEVHEEVRFDKIQNTQIRRGFAQKLMGDYGTVSVSTAGSNMSALKLSSIKDSKKVHKMISDRTDSSYSDTNNNNTVENDNVTKNELFEEYKKLRQTTEKLQKQIKGDKI